MRMVSSSRCIDSNTHHNLDLFPANLQPRQRVLGSLTLSALAKRPGQAWYAKASSYQCTFGAVARNFSLLRVEI